MSDWRKNPNLVECFDNCVAMFRTMPDARPIASPRIASPLGGRPLVGAMTEVRRRRLALGLSQLQLAAAAGLHQAHISQLERVELDGIAADIIAVLDRLEAERAQPEAAE